MSTVASAALSAETSTDPVSLARGIHARLGIVAPHEIAIELIAYHLGACVHYRPAGSADARVARYGSRAILAIAESARGTARARFSVAHELGHFLLHADYDAIARIHGIARTSPREFKVETEANRFASEILLPWALASPRCQGAKPTLDAVGELARTFGVSLSVAAQKWAANHPTACAYVETRGTKIKRAVRSPRFRGVAVERRALEEGTLALDMVSAGGDRGRRLHSSSTSRAWGSSNAGSEVVEECVTLGDGQPGGKVLTWLWHE